MRRLLPIALALISLNAALYAGEPDFRPGLEVEGAINSIEVSPSGEIWFGTARGRVFRSSNWNRSWQEVATPIIHDGDADPNFTHIGQVRFFDGLRGFLSGYLGEDHNLLYRTVDAGAHWDPVALPSSVYAYDAQADSTGQGWLVGSNGDVLFTQDFGASWLPLKPPYDHDSRSLSVHFVSRSTGLVSSLHGGLKWTDSGGHSWKRIKSPAELGLRSCKDERITTARILGDNVIVAQCGDVFYRTLAGHRTWQVLRAGERPLMAYELWSHGLIAVASDLEVIEIEPDLATIHTTGSYLQAGPLDIAVGADRAVFMDLALRVSVFDSEGFRTSWMMKEEATTSSNDTSLQGKPISDREAIAEYLANGYHFDRDFDRVNALAQVKRIDALGFLAKYESHVRFYFFPTSASSLSGHVAIAVDHRGAVVKVSDEEGLDSILKMLDLGVASAADAIALARDFLLLTNVHWFYWEGEPGGVNIISSVNDIPFNDDLEGRLERIIVTRSQTITPPSCESTLDGFAYRFFSWRPDEGALYRHSMSISSFGFIHHERQQLLYAYGKYTTGCSFPLDMGPEAEALASLISADDQGTSELVVDYILMLAGSDHLLYELRLKRLKEKPILHSALVTLPAGPNITFQRKIERAERALN